MEAKMTNTTNTNVTFKGNKLTLLDKALSAGSACPEFVLTAGDLSDLRSESLKNKILIISCVPSLDTPVCSIQTKRFNQAADDLPANVVILTVSKDLPFAQKRWCGAEGCQKVVCASDYKYGSFGKKFGVQIQELGLLSRAIFVVDQSGKLVHIEYVPEVTNEPDYEAALAKVRSLL
jgi:thioredoxin-dependent peroxiredoxin